MVASSEYSHGARDAVAVFGILWRQSNLSWQQRVVVRPSRQPELARLGVDETWTVAAALGDGR